MPGFEARVRISRHPLCVSDVVAVGLTTGAVGLLGSLLSYFSARGQSRTTFAIGIQNSQIELAKVNAENTRLRQQHREDERRERRTAYVDFLTAFEHFDSFGFITSATPEEFLAAQSRFKLSHATILMVGSSLVQTRSSALANAISSVVDTAYADEDRSGLDAWRHAYKESADKLEASSLDVTDAMHEDVIAEMLVDQAE
jgi:hypothetical protein